jgi:hypothetical protein
MLIGLAALALMLCISPVAALSGDDFEVVIDESGWGYTYTYHNVNDPSEEYIKISTGDTQWMYSLVTFKPADIPDAPTMMVDTYHSLHPKTIYLSQSVDYWDIKYYSSYSNGLKNPDPKFLKNHGIVNLKEFFGEYIKYGLRLELSWYQCIYPRYYFLLYFLDDRVLEYYIPGVDWGDRL